MLKHVSCRSSSSSLSRSCDHSFKSPLFSAEGPVFGSRTRNDGDEEEGRERMMTMTTRNHRDGEDDVSLVSTLSFSSLRVGGIRQHGHELCFRGGSTVSLNDQSTVPVKVYLRRLRSDMEYKTVSLSLQTTCKELVLLLLNKFRLRHRDPNLFFVLMEVAVRAPSDGGGPVRRQLVLEDNARPAELQQCRPKGEANFSIGVRRGGLVRVHDSILMPGSQYKSLMVSYNTTADQLVKLLLSCYNRKEDSRQFCLHEVCKNPASERLIDPDEFPIRIQSSWPREDKNSFAFVLRRSSHYSLSIKSMLSWRRSLEQCSTDTESESGDHDTTRASIMSYSSTASNSSTISNASSSSGVSSDSSLTCSSSGVSSTEGDSLAPSPQASPSSNSLHSSPSERSPTDTESKPTGRPPKPVPRTLFPSRTLPKVPTTDDEDSGIGIEEEDVTPIKVVDDDEDDDEDLRPQLPVRAFTISYGSVLKPVSKYANVKSLSKSSVDLKSSVLDDSGVPQSKSSIDLSLSGLVEGSPLAKSTPKNSRSIGDTVSSSLKLMLSTSQKKLNECSCKSCFYI